MHRPMTLPDYLLQTNVADLPIEYPWTRIIANSFQANPGEKNRQLFDAIERLGVRAAFALAIACSEWVAARLLKHVDNSDSLLRIEAAWTATIDWRYAHLPEPAHPGKTPAHITHEPLWIAMLMLSDGHMAYSTAFRQPNYKHNGTRSMALRCALVARHIIGDSNYEKWLSNSLRRASKHHPRLNKPVATEPPVAREFFEPGFRWRADAATTLHSKLLQTLRPAGHPYLRTKQQMQADGFVGEPYPA